MILNFDNFQKANQSGSKLNNIRIKNLNIFKEKGFPTKKEENWKYTDLNRILSNNLSKLEILNDKKTSQYNSEWVLKNFQHNQIILVNGDFVGSNFSFETKEKITIKPLKTILNEEKDFEKIRNYFDVKENSLNFNNLTISTSEDFIKLQKFSSLLFMLSLI